MRLKKNSIHFTDLSLVNRELKFPLHLKTCQNVRIGTNHMNKNLFAFKIVFVIFSICTASMIAKAEVTPPSTEIEVDPATSVPKRSSLDHSLKPGNSDEISSLFDNVVAVQRRAKVKSGKFLFNPYFSYDFSDAPLTMYGIDLNFGYAIGEFWEVYLNYTPYYVNQERAIAAKVRDLGPLQSTGKTAEVTLEKVTASYGVEVNWVPIYGKDSWGPYGIIRSDTYLNMGISLVKQDTGNGLKYKMAIGKTFFLGDYFNLRFNAGAAYVERRALSVITGTTIGLLEAGVVYYF